MSRLLPTSHGPFRADQIRSGDPYELSNGHAIRCMTTGGRGSRANLLGGAMLDSDPDVEEAGIDTGYSPSSETLRAPDVAVGNVPDLPGWVAGAPPLAVEYADTGQDEDELATKISELFAAGTKVIWVVRLGGPRRVEIYRAGEETKLAHQGDELTAPGILRNPVPVAALYDRETAHEVTFRNLLQRRGYDDLDAVRTEAMRASIVDVLEARGLELDGQDRTTLDACRDLDTLRSWLGRAATVSSAREVFRTSR